MMGSATTTRGNLPAELTSFIGRRRHIQEVKAALTAARLVTLVGPGGVGKTRLAISGAPSSERSPLPRRSTAARSSRPATAPVGGVSSPRSAGPASGNRRVNRAPSSTPSQVRSPSC
jgi:hypothetical protein